MSIDSDSPASSRDSRTEVPVQIVGTGRHSQLVAITLPSGRETGETVHHSSDQVVFIVEGSAQAILNGQAEAAYEHDALFIPAGTVHTLKNSGRMDLKVFVTYSPPVAFDPGLSQTSRTGRMNFYAIAQSAALAERSDANVQQPFPSGIKWASWKSPTLTNVLFATDFSPASEAALPYAISIARHYSSHLHVAHVINPETYGLMAPQVIERILSEVREAAASRIEELIRSRYGRDAQFQPMVAEGVVGDALLDIVRSKSIDLVVLGTHGRRGLRKLVLGSIAEEVFRLAPCPVLTVGPQAGGAGPEPVKLTHIVYPMELTADVVNTAGYAISLAKEYGAELTFLNVIEEPSMSGDEKAWINVTAEHWFEDKVAPNLGIGEKAHFMQEFGDAATAILKCAAQRRADLIVMNVHGAHPVLAGRIPGIVHRVVVGASCPVLTVH